MTDAERQQREKDLKESVKLLIAAMPERREYFTPSVAQLIEEGLPALKLGVLDLLWSPNPLTRRQAQFIIERVAYRHLRYQSRVEDDLKVAEEYDMLVRGMDYDWDNDRRRRDAAARRWGKWVDEQMISIIDDWHYGDVGYRSPRIRSCAGN